MTELIKTIIFLTLAVVIGITAIASLPRNNTQSVGEVRNKPLFPTIDTDKISRIRVVSFDGVAAESFEISKTATGWVLPSEYNYPVDRQSQLNAALTFLPDLVVTNIASDREADKAKFGVIEPNEAVENLGEKNVGTLIELLGDADVPLASAVIGSRVAGDQGKSFVLVPGRPHIYVVELNPDTLTTNFRDWINRDLVRIDPYRIERLALRHVESATPTANPATGEIDPGIVHDYEIVTGFHNGIWQIENLFDFDEDGQAKEVKLDDGTSLNSTQMTEFAGTLADLQMSDVKRKPTGLKTDVLRDKEFIGKITNQMSLRDHGFFVLPGGPGGFQVVPKGGELIVSMKGGVEYIIRFGDFAKATLDDLGQANRYVMVSARVNEDLLPMPVRGGSEKDDADPDDAPPVPDGVDPDASTSDAGSNNKEDEQTERAYLRKVQARNENLARAKEEVTRLNQRYAPWYYIISQNAFEKLTPPKSVLLDQR